MLSHWFPLLLTLTFDLVSSNFNLQDVQYNAYKTLTQVAVDITTGNVYLGGKDILISMDQDLGVKEVEKVGPMFDSEECYADPEPCSASRTFTSNFINILEINTIHSYLLVCGTAGQGMCKVHFLSDLKKTYSFNITNSASFVGSKKSSVALFGEPPYGYNTDNRMLYVAMATYDRTSEVFMPYVISTREIFINETNSRIQYLLDNSFQESYIKPHSFTTAKKFQVEYLYGFEHNGYIYYISIQPVSVDLTQYVTRVVQFCRNDRVYNTYIETAISCFRGSSNKTDKGIEYTLATAAYLARQGDEADDILAISFGKPYTSPKNQSSEYGSVVCNYSMKSLREHFLNLRHRCSNGGNGEYPWWIYGSKQVCRISNPEVTF